MGGLLKTVYFNSFIKLGCFVKRSTVNYPRANIVAEAP